MLKPFFPFIAMLLVAACGVSYHLEPARLTIPESDRASRQTVIEALSQLLREKGFEELGTDERMISLLSETLDPHDPIVVELKHRYTFLHEARDLRVVVIDFTVPVMRARGPPYDPPPGPYFELSIYEGRPGGFSSEGHEFVLLLQEELRRMLGAPVAMATPPPASDPGTYWTITITNALAMAVWWTMIFLVAMTVYAALAKKVLRNARLPLAAKRIIFVLAGTWLSAPMPFPAASILVVMLPNVLAFPWTDIEYYQRAGSVAALSFPVAFLLSTLVAIRIFPATPDMTDKDPGLRA